MRKKLSFLFLLFLVCPVFAEENTECMFYSAGPAVTWTAPVCCKGEFVVQPFFVYNRTRGIFDSDSGYHSLGGDKQYQFMEQLFAMFGITDHLELDGQIEIQENYIEQDGEKANSTGIGDSFLWLRYCVVSEKESTPHITGLVQLKLPTGKYENGDITKLGADLTGSGSYDLGPGLILTKSFGKLVLHADASYSFPFETDIDGVDIRYGNYLNYDLGIEYFLPKGFNILFEINGLVQDDSKEDGEKISDSDIYFVTAGTGIGWSNEKIQTLLAYQRIIAGKNNDANDSVIATFVYKF
jgi:hypothetical protein